MYDGWGRNQDRGLGRGGVGRRQSSDRCQRNRIGIEEETGHSGNKKGRTGHSGKGGNERGKRTGRL